MWSAHSDKPEDLFHYVRYENCENYSKTQLKQHNNVGNECCAVLVQLYKVVANCCHECHLSGMNRKQVK